MGDICNFRPKNAAIDPDVVLQEAAGQFDSLVIIGWDKEGLLDARASLNLNHAEIHFLISVFQHKLLSSDFSGDIDDID
ncbi:hypothetical protein [Methylomonas koyamae]|uniref:hypothetical protein n=1 Tax=Methylomonas koyamae TaxID=702114 RepID=UPI00112767B2|nr:hypothetical protein [Methylomonas koyamae]TPQ24942.1 hypothetical protein C2U68_17350 [Methylomonas koyamae]